MDGSLHAQRTLVVLVACLTRRWLQELSHDPQMRETLTNPGKHVQGAGESYLQSVLNTLVFEASANIPTKSRLTPLWEGMGPVHPGRTLVLPPGLQSNVSEQMQLHRCRSLRPAPTGTGPDMMSRGPYEHCAASTDPLGYVSYASFICDGGMQVKPPCIDCLHPLGSAMMHWG